jgi:hypothetical protein
MQKVFSKVKFQAGWGILVIVAAAVAGWLAAPRGSVSAHQAPGYQQSAAASTALITHYDSSAGKTPLLTVVNSNSNVMAVYQIDPATGEITLRGVRNFNYDLQMDEFNGVSPTPREIRSLLQRR